MGLFMFEKIKHIQLQLAGLTKELHNGVLGYFAFEEFITSVFSMGFNEIRASISASHLNIFNIYTPPHAHGPMSIYDMMASTPIHTIVIGINTFHPNLMI